jgi:hypothetical protein
MPLARPAVLGVDIEDRLGAGDRRQGRVRNERAQEPRESLMLGFIEMALAPEKDNAMAQQGVSNCGHPRSRQIARQSHTMDFGTDCRRDWADIEARVGRMGVIGRGGSVRHVRPLV